MYCTNVPRRSTTHTVWGREKGIDFSKLKSLSDFTSNYVISNINDDSNSKDKGFIQDNSLIKNNDNRKRLRDDDDDDEDLNVKDNQILPLSPKSSPNIKSYQHIIHLDQSDDDDSVIDNDHSTSDVSTINESKNDKLLNGRNLLASTEDEVVVSDPSLLIPSNNKVLKKARYNDEAYNKKQFNTFFILLTSLFKCLVNAQELKTFLEVIELNYRVTKYKIILKSLQQILQVR